MNNLLLMTIWDIVNIITAFILGYAIAYWRLEKKFALYKKEIKNETPKIPTKI